MANADEIHAHMKRLFESFNAFLAGPGRGSATKMDRDLKAYLKTIDHDGELKVVLDQNSMVTFFADAKNEKILTDFFLRAIPMCMANWRAAKGYTS
jgi:NAD(P)H-hydrate repair Nnr-like enzyme with NAD(P)H-hydrate dehydratase domain